MNTLASMIKVSLCTGLLLAGLLFTAPALAQSDQAEAQRLAEEAELRAHRESLMAKIEAVRQEAERAAEEARMKAERLRRETERMRVETEQVRENSEAELEAHRREMSRMREEISRTHRELRKASQEVARAHRDLALAEDRELRTRVINLGDRAMMGVILGRETDQGIAIVGISPDGPAEHAGMKTGDVLVSLRGEDLAGEASGAARSRVYRIMSEVDEGEEISAAVLRDGERWEFMIEPEKREPASWASYIRLPDPPQSIHAPDAPDAPTTPDAPEVEPASPSVRIEHIAVPPLDVAELAAEAESLARELDSFKIRFEGPDGDPMVYEYDYQFNSGDFDFEFENEDFVQLGEMALNEAQIWLGSPATAGIRFTELNDGLKGYFDADRGVLVLDAPSNNPLGLQAGDVVLEIGSDEVNATADIVRALRDIEAGDTFRIAIKRNRKDESLEVVMPENRLGMLHERLLDRHDYAPVIVEPDED